MKKHSKVKTRRPSRPGILSAKRSGRKLVVRVDLRQGERKLHDFLGIWKEHIHDEIQIHRRLLEGKRNFKQHLGDTIEIHERFINRVKKL